MASCSDDRTVRIYDLRSNQPLQFYNAHKAPVNEISFHPTGLYMASCSDDSKVKIWDLRKGKALFSILSHAGPVQTVDFSFAGDYFASAGNDKMLQVWKSNFYDSQTREPDIIPCNIKRPAADILPTGARVEVPAEQAGGRLSNLVRERLGEEVLVFDEQAQKARADEQRVVEVEADAKIGQTLDRINGQIVKILGLMKVGRGDENMESKVTANEEDIMKLTNFVKNDLEKHRVEYLETFKSAKSKFVL